MTKYGPSKFTRELIGDLSNDRFRFRAWRRFLSRSWQRSLEDLHESPALTRSFIWSVTVVALLGLGVLFLSWQYQSGSVAVQSLSWWLPWYLLAIIFVLTHLGMADDGGDRRLERFNVPNHLSFMRLALAPLILMPGLVLPVDGIGGPLFAVFAAFLALTDVLDGWIARRTGTVTRLGRMLDNLGDLVYLTFLSVGLYLAAAIPASLLWLLVVRYPLVCLGTMVLYFVRGPAQLSPTVIGRATTFILSIVLLLIGFNLWLRTDWLVSPWLEWAVQGLHVLIGANVVYLVYRATKWNGIQRVRDHHE